MDGIVSSRGKLLIRADANAAIVTGHIMRMIALAQAWRKIGGEAVFICARATSDLRKKIEDIGSSIEKINVVPGSQNDLEATCDLIARHAAGSATVPIVLDGYHFGAGFQHVLKANGRRVLVVDDYGHADFYHADFVLNQNISAREEMYSRRESGTRLLLGPKFALLRSEFSNLSDREPRIPDEASRVLVTLGGVDFGNATKKVIDAFAGSSFEVKVAVGGSNPHLQSLRQAAADATTGGTTVELVVNSFDMPALMGWADMAIAAGGSTCYELAFVGLPTLLMVLADNQEQNARELERQGFGGCLGWDTEFEPRSFRAAAEQLAGDRCLRASFASHGRAIVDGLGASRVAALLADEDVFQFRRVGEEDFRLLWEWANNEVTRANSFDSSPISWETHCAWCRGKLEDPRCTFWIVSTPAFGDMGCVRFDDQSGEAVVSLSLSPQARGKGYGSKIIKQACSRLFADKKVNMIHALIKPANEASIKVFERAGFRWSADTLVNGQKANCYLLPREN